MAKKNTDVVDEASSFQVDDPFADMDDERLSALTTQLRSTWAERDAVIKEMRALRFSEHDIEVPSAYEQETVRTPVAYQIIEHMVGTMTVDDPLISVTPASEARSEEEKASRLEVATQQILHQLNRQSGEDAGERFVESLIADGHGCMRLFHAAQYWRGMPQRDKKAKETEADYLKRADAWTRGKPLPISWSWVDPLNVFPVWSEMGLEAVLEVDERSPLGLDADRFNQRDNLPDIWDTDRLKAQGGTVEFAQLWTNSRLIYAVDGHIVHNQKHGYERPPYVYAFGTSPSTREPGRVGLSVLYPLRHILPYYDRLLSQKASAIRIWSWPTPVLKTPRGAPDDTTPHPIEVRPGEPLSLWDDEDVGFLTWAGNGPDSDEMLGIMNSAIQQAGLANVMYGQSASGDSGYLVNQLIAASRMRFKPIVDHAETAYEQLVQALWDIVEYKIKAPLYVFDRSEKSRGWVRLDPADLNGYRQVRVTLNPALPTDEYARSSRAISEMNAGLRDRSSAMEMIGIEQPDEMVRKIRVDRYMEDPQVVKFLTTEALQRQGIMAEERHQMEGYSPEQLAQMLPNMPPALQAALASAGGGTANGSSGQIMAAPGVQAIPATPTPTAAQILPRTPPAGQATGRAPGTKRTGDGR